MLVLLSISLIQSQNGPKRAFPLSLPFFQEMKLQLRKVKSLAPVQERDLMPMAPKPESVLAALPCYLPTQLNTQPWPYIGKAGRPGGL